MKPNKKLQDAMASIKQVLIESDIAGVVVLSDGQGAAEYMSHIDPSWSCLSSEVSKDKDGAWQRCLRFKAKVKTGGIAEFEKAAATINMICCTCDLLAHLFDGLNGIKTMVSKHFEITEGAGKFIPEEQH